jgi:hypothetical protein
MKEMHRFSGFMFDPAPARKITNKIFYALFYSNTIPTKSLPERRRGAPSGQRYHRPNYEHP